MTTKICEIIDSAKFPAKNYFRYGYSNMARVGSTDFPESLDMFPALLGWMPA